MSRSLAVWWDERKVGVLSLDRHGDMRFAYGEPWLSDPSAPPISFSLPKRKEAFSRREARPFFDGLLPEEEQRIAIAAALGVSPRNEFKLLEHLGGEVAGALTLWPEDQPLPAAPDNQATEALSERELIAVLDRLPKRPLLAGERGLRLSLAGAQSKLPIVLVDGQVALPAPGQPTTHILKPPIARFENTTENEAFALRLAVKLNLDVAGVELRAIDGRPYLLVERYDRVVDSRGGVRRLHQEDFCQALGVFTERKYAAEGGPTFKTSFDLIRRTCTRPAVDVLKLLDAAISQVLIGNADAHGKNYSILHRDGTIALAPLYDLLCTVAYPDLSPTFAMKVARRGTLEELKVGDWDIFAKEAGLTPPFVRRRVGELATAALSEAPKVAAELSADSDSEHALRDYQDRLCRRAERLGRTV